MPTGCSCKPKWYGKNLQADELSDSVLNVLVDEVKQKTKSLGPDGYPYRL